MNDKRLRELSDPHGKVSLATRFWAADRIKELEAQLDVSQDTIIEEYEQRIAELEAQVDEQHEDMIAETLRANKAEADNERLREAGNLVVGNAHNFDKKTECIYVVYDQLMLLKAALEKEDELWRGKMKRYCRPAMAIREGRITSYPLGEHQRDCDTCQAELEIERLRGALDKLARLGNEPHYGNSDGNMIARAALEGGE